MEIQVCVEPAKAFQFFNYFPCLPYFDVSLSHSVFYYFSIRIHMEGARLGIWEAVKVSRPHGCFQTRVKSGVMGGIQG